MCNIQRWGLQFPHLYLSLFIKKGVILRSRFTKRWNEKAYSHWLWCLGELKRWSHWNLRADWTSNLSTPLKSRAISPAGQLWSRKHVVPWSETWNRPSCFTCFFWMLEFAFCRYKMRGIRKDLFTHRHPHTHTLYVCVYIYILYISSIHTFVSNERPERNILYLTAIVLQEKHIQ